MLVRRLTTVTNFHVKSRNFNEVERSFSSNESASCSDEKVYDEKNLKKDILFASLPHVHEHGWTDASIAHGVMSARYPPSTIGLVKNKGAELLAFFMDQCNIRLVEELEQLHHKNKEKVSYEDISRKYSTERIEQALRLRLEMVVPYIRSNRWHEGMALGAMYPSHALATSKQLNDMVEIICRNSLIQKDRISRTNFLPTTLEKSAIVGVYIATELHLLADSSTGNIDTWKFLNQRIAGLDSLISKGVTYNLNVPGQEIATATTAVATSLGGAVFSLAAPVLQTGSTAVASRIIPHIMNFVQAQNDSPNKHFVPNNSVINNTYADQSVVSQDKEIGSENSDDLISFVNEGIANFSKKT